MTKKQLMDKLVAEYKNGLKIEGNLRTVRRKVLKIAGNFTKQELEELWEKHLRKPTEAYYKRDTDAYEVDKFRRQVWKRRTNKAKTNLIEKASDFVRRTYTTRQEKDMAHGGKTHDHVDVERGTSFAETFISLQLPVTKDKVEDMIARLYSETYKWTKPTTDDMDSWVANGRSRVVK